jgi:hypothetical protein
MRPNRPQTGLVEPLVRPNQLECRWPSNSLTCLSFLLLVVFDGADVFPYLKDAQISSLPT